MYQKKIKPYAIVPPELYVKRDADRQLRQIIEDMGRPGYVLVSRQMGKTNLLLNAKREFSNTKHCFVYLDISNTFADQRDFFRNVIDTCIDSSGEAAINLAVKISESRNKTIALQAHREHEFELKSIIDDIEGNLIICLDEIDALSKVEYSDSVFSLIRSIYFSGRTNSPQLKRLTYVLSGVADPADLIKNKAISPFNIGEKIYLDDFSLDECSSFLRATGLSLGLEIIERIYYWTCGYPRVTWDVCSAIEAKLESASSVSKVDVDQIVNELYMLSFNLPPYDHIRARVAKDRDIRNAVMSIHYGKSSNISDKMKDKLYLSGISTPKNADGSINFKNRIMADALSEKWISEIEHDSATFFERASLASKEGNYIAAIGLYEEALEQSISTDLREFLTVELATCCMHAGQIIRAIEIFDQCTLPPTTTRDLIDRKTHNYGACLLLNRNYSAAIEKFEELIKANNEEGKGSYFYETHINLATALILKSSEANYSNYQSNEYIRAEDILNWLVANSIEISDELTLPSAHRILMIANYKLFEINLDKGDLKAASHNIEVAINFADKSALILLDMQKIQFITEISKRHERYNTFVDNLLSSKQPLAEAIPMDVIQFTSERCAELIIKLAENSLVETLRKLCVHFDMIYKDSNKSAWSILNLAIASGIKKRQFEQLSKLACIALEFSEEVSAYELRIMIVFGLVSPNKSEMAILSEAYTSRVLSATPYDLDEFDFRILWSVSDYYFEQKYFEHIEKLLSLIGDCFISYADKLGDQNDSVIAFAILIIFMNFRSASIFDHKLILSERIIKYVDKIQNIQEIKFPTMPANFGLTLARNFNLYLEPQQLGIGRKFSRNSIVTVKFNSGKVQTGKFKKFSNKIENGECTIMDK